jgi:hypothetical protein
MYKLSGLIVIAALVCPGVATTQPVRKYNDKGAPPFKPTFRQYEKTIICQL